MTRIRLLPVVLLATGLLLLAATGCQEQPTLPQPREQAALDTAYVQITPPFPGFTGPEDLMIGRDQLLYVADTRADRIVMLNRVGQVLSERTMLRPRALAQDSRLDLLVGGEIVAPSGDSIAAIFRIRLVSTSPDSAHRLDRAPIDTVWTEPARPARRFPGIAVLGNNEYLVVRTGPDNSSFVDPDGRLLLFSAADRLITPVPGLTTRAGSGITDINRPTDVEVFPGLRDFVLAQSSEGVAYGAIWMRYEQTPDFDGWLPRFDPARPEDQNVDFIRPGRYLQPEAVGIDPARRDIFVADAGLDSIFKYNSRGRFMPESFGVARSDSAMLEPSGLAYFERVLYVLDRRRGEILRFRLTTDFPR